MYVTIGDKTTSFFNYIAVKTDCAGRSSVSLSSGFTAFRFKQNAFIQRAKTGYKNVILVKLIVSVGFAGNESITFVDLDWFEMTGLRRICEGNKPLFAADFVS